MQFDSDRLAELDFGPLVQAIQSQIGFGLLTVLGVDPNHTLLSRCYTSAPQTYRAGECWPLPPSPWQARIFEQAGAVLCRNPGELRAMFRDAAEIEALGLGSAISVPVRSADDRSVIGVVNVLDAADRYGTRQLGQLEEICKSIDSIQFKSMIGNQP